MKIQELIESLAIECKPIVEKIEAEPEVCQYHYDAYCAYLVEVSRGNTGVALMLAIALVKAGANKSGVAYGLELFADLDSLCQSELDGIEA